MFFEETILGQPSWVLESGSVRLAVTRAGAHMAPVVFGRETVRPVEPYHISPWQGETHGVAQGRCDAVLRGDFFCLPFGYAEPELGVYPHGRSAGMEWTLVDAEADAGLHRLRIGMEDALLGARVTREFLVHEGENAIYDVTTVAGLDGAYTMGHHAVLRTPARSEALLVSTSRQKFGMTFDGQFGAPERGEYQSLARGAEFESLASVPSLFRDTGPVDCSAYPTRRGFSDLLQVAVEPEPGQPAWTAAVNTEEGYLWYSLRDDALLPSTILWIENRGRHGAPWNGRNCSLGLEDVCAYFDRGSEASRAANPFSRRGVRTVHAFEREMELRLPYVQGVVRTPEDFGRVERVVCDGESASFVDGNGVRVTAKVQTGFVFGEELRG